MKSIAHHWMQQGREEEKAIMAKKNARRKSYDGRENAERRYSIRVCYKNYRII